MMKIRCYDLRAHEGKPTLVEEKSISYKGEDELTSPEKVANAFRKILELEDMTEERLYVIATNKRGRVTGVFEVSHGTMNNAPGNLIGIFKRLLLIDNCANFFLVHNHPSGDPRPSEADILLTQKVDKISQLFDNELVLLDHIIISKYNFYSLKANMDF